MQVIVEGVGVVVADVAVNTTNSQVHLTQSPGGRVGLLSVYGNITDLAAMSLHKFLTLDKHAA